MNTDQMLSIMRTLLKTGGTWLIAHHVLGVSAGNWDLISGVLLAALGVVASHVSHGGGPDDPQLKFPLWWAVLSLGILGCGGGCGSITSHGYILSQTTRGLGFRVQTAAQGNSTPEVDFGFFSVNTQFLPTSTNGPMWTARYMNSIDTKSSFNPIDTSISEHIGAGDVYLGGTNDVDKAIIPSEYKAAFTPLNVRTNASPNP